MQILLFIGVGFSVLQLLLHKKSLEEMFNMAGEVLICGATKIKIQTAG